MDNVLYYINRSNQRSLRMLSVIDLIAAGTLSLELASWLIAKISVGSSFLVGAKPGSAGKTTIMSAFFAFIPDNAGIHLADKASSWGSAKKGEYLLSYEIGSGPHDSYIWGADLQKFCSLGASGVKLVSNIHADTLEQAKEQIVVQNRVKEVYFNSFSLFIPIEIGKDMSRKVGFVNYFDDGKWKELKELLSISSKEEKIKGFLENCQKKKVILIEDVRKEWLKFFRSDPL